MPDKTEGTSTAPRARVGIVRAGDYDEDVVRAAVAEALGLIGGIGPVLGNSRRVFVKVNLLPPPSPPERGIVTHPVFAEAVIKLLKAAGAEVTVGDDIEDAGDGFGMSGYRDMCQRAGVPLLNLREAGFTEVAAGGRILEKVYVSRVALEADVIVNLPKLKTHSLTVYTGAVKNMYGAVPGSFRRRFHGEFVKSEDFSLMLTDVFSAIRPHLTIMDGIVAMQGAGPGAGDLRRSGIVLASRDGVALDAVAGSIIGLDPADVDTTRYCHQSGLGIGKLERIDVLGESIRSVAVPDFKLPAAASRALLRRVPRTLSRFLLRQTVVRPRVDAERCTACAECVRVCPTGAMTLVDDVASVNYAACVECLCCHEVCRFGTIDLTRPAAGAAVLKIAGALRR